MAFAAGIGAAAALAGTAGTAVSNWKLQQDAQKHQIKMYRQRYQWTMEDMRTAGLNPLLAYSQGPGSAGSTPLASVPDFGAALSKGLEAGAGAAKKVSERSKVKEEEANVVLERDLIREQVQTTAAQGLRDSSQAALNTEQTRLTSAKATAAERMQPVYDVVGDVTSKGTEAARDLYNKYAPEVTNSAEQLKKRFEKWWTGLKSRPQPTRRQPISKRRPRRKK